MLSEKARAVVDCIRWQRVLEFEIHRLSYGPGKTYLKELETEIRSREKESFDSRDSTTKIYQLACLKQDLKSLRKYQSSMQKLEIFVDRLLEKGMIQGVPEGGVEIFENLRAYHEKTKAEQRRRQWELLADFRQIWPTVDQTRKRDMIGVLARYSKTRFRCGFRIFGNSPMLKFLVWLTKRTENTKR